jgi:hypothetical protein
MGNIAMALSLMFGLMLITTTGCSQRHDRFSGIRRAELKIQSRIDTGVSIIEYPQIISDLAFELSLAKEGTLNEHETAIMEKHNAVLQTYQSAKEVWEIENSYQRCLTSDDFKYFPHGACREPNGFYLALGRAYTGPSPTLVAKNAHLTLDTLFDNGVQTVWQMARQQVEEARKL